MLLEGPPSGRRRVRDFLIGCAAVGPRVYRFLRLRQFLASRSEIIAGDRMVLTTLRAHARGRQRSWLGLPLLVLGAAVAGRDRAHHHSASILRRIEQIRAWGPCRKL